MTKFDTFTISGGFTVPRFGYGAMRLTGQPGNFGPYADWEDGKRLLRRWASGSLTRLGLMVLGGTKK